MTGLWLRKVGPQCVFLAGVCWPRGTDRLSAFFLSNLMSIILFSFVFSFFLSFMATALPKGLSYFSPFLSSFPPVISCQLFLSHFYLHQFSSVQFSSVAQSCPTLCDPMNGSMPGLPVHHQLLESTQTHVHRVGDAIQPSHPLLTPSSPAPNPSQHQSLFQRVNSLHEVAKVLEFQL